jgi:hypothetical protein
LYGVHRHRHHHFLHHHHHIRVSELQVEKHDHCTHDRIHDGYDEDKDDDVVITITRGETQRHAFFLTVSQSALEVPQNDQLQILNNKKLRQANGLCNLKIIVF